MQQLSLYSFLITTTGSPTFSLSYEPKESGGLKKKQQPKTEALKVF